MGGSEMHQATLADAAPDPATNKVPASKPPNNTLLNFILRSLVRTESVAESTYRVDQPRAPILLQFLPDSRNMHLERVRLRPGRHGPNRLRELRVGHELPAAAHQGGQDAKFDSRQDELPAGAARAALAEVDHHVAGGEARTALAAMTPDYSFDARHQLFERERLGHVIVSPELQTRDAVADGRLGADSDQRGVRLRPKGLEQLGPIVVGQHQVEQHDVRVPLAHELQAAARRLHGADGIAFLSQPGGDGPRQAPVIFHQGDLPLDGHADGILPWNLRRSEPRTATAEFSG